VTIFHVILLEPQIVDYLFLTDRQAGTKAGSKLKDEVMKIMPVQKQTAAGQRTRFKAVVVTGDENGHIGVGVKLAKEVQFAIKGALMAAKINIVPVRRGYWGARIGEPHTIALKMRGKCGSVTVRLIPAPRGTGIVGAPVTKKILQMAGVKDCYTASGGKTRTVENFIKACYNALHKSYKYLTPDLWKDLTPPEHPYSKFADKVDELKLTFQKEKEEIANKAHP
jgi:small subunit ribosomal protein S2e